MHRKNFTREIEENEIFVGTDPHHIESLETENSCLSTVNA